MIVCAKWAVHEREVNEPTRKLGEPPGIASEGQRIGGGPFEDINLTGPVP